MEKGVISQNDLMHKLVNAKKVMNKVDSGNYEKGHVNENILRSSPEELDPQTISTQSATRMPQGLASVDRINQSINDKVASLQSKAADQLSQLASDLGIEGLETGVPTLPSLCPP